MKKGLKITLRAIVDFIPLIIHWSIPSDRGLIIGGSVALLVVISKGIKKELGLMTKVVAVYFILINIFYFYLGMNIFFDKRHLISYGVLATMSFWSILCYRPFTMDASKKAYASIKDSSLFIEMNIIITKIFGVVYSINTILAYFEIKSAPLFSLLLTGLAISASIILPSFMPDT
ncbi:MAG: hypothetical protein N4A62_11175 [Marinisporobacter sp.]|jgi:preprotein translocase subunit SecG|nr:hypothetical protein [Marinisporobacter sp.]